MWYVCVRGKREQQKAFFLPNLQKRNHLKDLDLDGKIILKWILKEQAGRAWPGVTEARIGVGVGIL
jgi:hypothetical protein